LVHFLLAVDRTIALFLWHYKRAIIARSILLKMSFIVVIISSDWLLNELISWRWVNRCTVKNKFFISIDNF